MQLFQPFLFLEFPIHAELAGEAALFAGPGGEAEVEGEGGGVRFYLPAEFKHAAAAFDAGGRRAVAVIAGLPGVEVFDVAVKLVVGGNFAYFAESQVGGDIVAAAVVVYI